VVIKVGEVLNEDFTVIDGDRDLVEGLEDSDFTKDLFDPDGNEVSDSIGVTISELGNGNYRATLTLNSTGVWFLVVYHPEYFPWGKRDSIQVFNSDFDSINDIITRIVGLSQENQYIDNTSYDDEDNLTSCRIRLYSVQSSVGSSSNVIATYLLTAGYNDDNQMEYFKVVKQ
jgi:hypothetical protein